MAEGCGARRFDGAPGQSRHPRRPPGTVRRVLTGTGRIGFVPVNCGRPAFGAAWSVDGSGGRAVGHASGCVRRTSRPSADGPSVTRGWAAFAQVGERGHRFREPVGVGVCGRPRLDPPQALGRGATSKGEGIPDPDGVRRPRPSGRIPIAGAAHGANSDPPISAAQSGTPSAIATAANPSVSGSRRAARTPASPDRGMLHGPMLSGCVRS